MVIARDAASIVAATFIMFWFQGMANIIQRENPTFDPLGTAFLGGIGVWLAFTLLWHSSSEVNVGLSLVRWWMPDWRNHYQGWGTGFAALIINIMVLLGAGLLAAYTCFSLQVSNAVTHAGIPVIGSSLTNAGVIEGLGAFFWGWAFYATHAWFTGEDVRVASVMPSGPIILGFTHIALVYLAFPYSSGSFNPFFWLSFAIVSGFYQTGYWIYIVCPLIGFITITVLWFWIYQSPESEEIMASITEEEETKKDI
jgi:hypothetical protein